MMNPPGSAPAADPVAGPAGSRRRWPHRILAGTFHKTGTIQWKSILDRFVAEFGMRFYRRNAAPPPADRQTCLDPHSLFPPPLLDGPHRGIVMFRDPRDVVVSGAFYHARLTPAQGDACTLLPEQRFGGRSYVETINAQPSGEEKLLFEMHEMGTRTIRHRLRFATMPEHFRRVHFEALVTERELAEFRRIFDGLGLPEDIRPRAPEIARENSLFSGRVTTSHVRSGRPGEWRDHFTPRLRQAFRQRFGHAAQRLRYPAD
jgi:hypothetical protein